MDVSQVVAAANHIKIFEIINLNGDVFGVLSTTDKIKSYPSYKDTISIGDANYTQAWLTAKDARLFLAAEKAFNKGA